jgi:hypothetical protein
MSSNTVLTVNGIKSGGVEHPLALRIFYGVLFVAAYRHVFVCILGASIALFNARFVMRKKTAYTPSFFVQKAHNVGNTQGYGTRLQLQRQLLETFPMFYSTFFSESSLPKFLFLEL